MKDIAIEYLGGSGFLVSLGGTGLLFDASESGPDRRALPDQAALAAFEKLYVFVSHHHDDHFSPAIYDLCGENATYILGFDIPQPYKGVRMSPGEVRTFGALTVNAYGSTDEGVSFCVDFAGVTLFHAGDLNLWHWRESNPPSARSTTASRRFPSRRSTWRFSRSIPVRAACMTRARAISL